ncbi:MAG: acyltransferase [Elusimicrobia bacterium]|nr:acyltransferase [Elusimicrobiota bacterium]
MRTAAIPGLDGLRAAAILLVILFHTVVHMRFPPSIARQWGFLLYNGWVGVDLFFALSGFLITTVILREEADRGAFSLKNFYARRGLRILPPFLIYFGLVAVTFGLFKSIETAYGLPEFIGKAPVCFLGYVLFLANYCLVYGCDGGMPSGFVVSWSLAVEEHFYMLWSLVLKAAPSRATRLAFAGAVCLGMPFVRWVGARHFGAGWLALQYASHYRIDSIMWGVLAALAMPELGRWVASRRAVLLLCGGLCAWMFQTKAVGVIEKPTLVGMAFGFTVISLFAASLVVEVASRPGSALTRALDSRVSAWIGRISYGMYLIHAFVVDAVTDLGWRLHPNVDSRWEGWILLSANTLAVVVVTVGLASLLYLTVDRRFLGFKRWFA